MTDKLLLLVTLRVKVNVEPEVVVKERFLVIVRVKVTVELEVTSRVLG